MPGSLLTPFNARSADRVTEEIRQQKNQGADFIKVGLVSPDVFFAASAEGKRVGLPVLGHLQEGVDAAQASRAGFRSIEHLGRRLDLDRVFDRGSGTACGCRATPDREDATDHTSCLRAKDVDEAPANTPHQSGGV